MVTYVHGANMTATISRANVASKYDGKGALLTVLTTKIRPSNLGFERRIQQVSYTFFILIKFHELCCNFYGQVHI
jgi:hypothetical protein